MSAPDLQGYGDFWLNVIGPPTLVAGSFGISRTVNSALGWAHLRGLSGKGSDGSNPKGCASNSAGPVVASLRKDGSYTTMYDAPGVWGVSNDV